MEALEFYTDHPFVDCYMTTQDEGYSQHFFKLDWFLVLMIISIFRMQLQTNMLCKMLGAYEWLNKK